MTYQDLLARRKRRQERQGISVPDNAIHASLKPFQRTIVQRALNAGRHAIWADTGLGKTRMMIEWARLTSGGMRLIVAPLAVCLQTVEEAATIGVEVTYVRSKDDITGPGIWITNFEMVPEVANVKWDAVALDEASILKQSDGKTRKMLIETFQETPYRTTWTATPAPNDPEELTNQAEFLGVMTRTNMLAAYFVHDSDAGWRLKGHAVDPMLDWMSTWAIAIRMPSELGDSDEGYVLPGLNIIPEIVHADVKPDDGELFAATVGGVSGRARVRRETLDARVQRAAELTQDGEQWCLWVGLNDEADALAKTIPDAVNIHGSLAPEVKAQGLHDFAKGRTRVLITKPAIAAMGLNFQSCSRTAFVGLGDSYEQYYQAIRRFYRFGQTEVVNAHIVLSALEQTIAHNVMRKERQANAITDGLIQRLNTPRKAA